MRKTLLLAVVSALFLFSCKKEHSPQVKPAQKMYKVTFDMASGFTQTIKSNSAGKQQTNSLQLDTVTTNLAAYTSIIRLVIIDSHGTIVRSLLQDASTVSNFGVIVDSLAAGTYSVLAVAGQANLRADDGGLPQVGAYPNVYYYLPQRLQNAWGDTFCSAFQLTVTNGAVNQTVALKRIVAKLEVDFNDVIPANASRLDIQLHDENFVYYPARDTTGRPDTLTYHLTIPNSVKGTNTYKVSEIVLNTSTPFNVILTAYDSSNAVIATHTITNVTCTKNQRTILTGNFSNTPTNNGQQFNVNVDPSWTSQNTVHY